jgi:hypothetical protein
MNKWNRILKMHTLYHDDFPPLYDCIGWSHVFLYRQCALRESHDIICFSTNLFRVADAQMVVTVTLTLCYTGCNALVLYAPSCCWCHKHFLSANPSAHVGSACPHITSAKLVFDASGFVEAS